MLAPTQVSHNTDTLSCDPASFLLVIEARQPGPPALSRSLSLSLSPSLSGIEPLFEALRLQGFGFRD